MASEVGDLYVVLRAVTEPFKRGLKEAAAEGEASTSTIGGAFQKLAKVGVVAGAAAVAVGAVSVKWAADFETQMTRLYTAAGLSNEMLKQAHMSTQQLDAAVLHLGNQTGFTGTQMAEALYHPISAGLDLKSALEVVKYAAEEARISGASLDDTTYSLSSVMKAFNFSASQAGPTMASLNAIVGEGDMRFQDFNESIKNWAPTAAQMGISVNSMGAGLAYLTDRGNSAEVAATRMTMGISMMTTPSKQAAKMLVGLGLASTDVKASSEAMQEAMQKAGITQNKLALDLKKPDGLYVALKDLKDGLEKAGVSGTEADSVLAKIFGGGRSDKAIMSLMQNLDGLKSKYDAISHDSSMEHFQSAWQKTQQTFNQQLHETEATLVNLGIKLGTMLLPYVQKFLGWIRVGIDWLMQHKVAVMALAGALGTALVAAIVAVGTALVASFGWVELIVVGVMAVGAALVYAYNHFKTFRTIVNDVATFMKGVFVLSWRVAGLAIRALAVAWDATAKAVHVIAKWFDQNVLKWIKARTKDLTDWWKSHSKEITEVWHFVFEFINTEAKVAFDIIKAALKVLYEVWKVVWGLIKDAVKLVWDAIKGIVTFGMHLILNIIGIVLDLITGHWGKAWADLKKLASQALHDVWSFIKNFFSDAGSLLYDAGRNIINGLINGIKDMIGGIGNAIGDVVTEIKDHLPWSPAKKGPLSGSGSPEIGGRNIGRQVASGLFSSVPWVAAAAEHMAGAAALSVGHNRVGSGLAALAAVPAGAAGAGGPTVVNYITVQGSVLTNRDIRDLVQREFLRLGARSSTTWQQYAR